MNAFDDVLDEITDEMLGCFGGDVSITLSNATTLFVRGVLSLQRADVEPNVASSTRYTAQVKTADVQAFQVAKNDTLRANGLNFTIVDIMPDDGGITTYVLRRYD